MYENLKKILIKKKLIKKAGTNFFGILQDIYHLKKTAIIHTR